MDWVAAVTALLGSGGVVATVVTLVRGRRKEKLDESTVRTTEADTVVQMALAQGKAALELNTATSAALTATQQDLDRTKVRLGSTQTDLEQTRVDLGNTQDELTDTTASLMAERRANDEYRQDLTTWAVWFRDKIVGEWDTVRQRATHPDGPTLRRTQRWDDSSHGKG